MGRCPRTGQPVCSTSCRADLDVRVVAAARAGDQTKIDTELTGKSWYLCSSPASDEKTEAWFSRVRAACEGVAAVVADEPGKTMKEMQAPRRTHTARRASIALF